MSVARFISRTSSLETTLKGACGGGSSKAKTSLSAVTPTYGGFRRDGLDTVAGSARRIFLCKGVVAQVVAQGR